MSTFIRLVEPSKIHIDVKLYQCLTSTFEVKAVLSQCQNDSQIKYHQNITTFRGHHRTHSYKVAQFLFRNVSVIVQTGRNRVYLSQ